MNLKKFFQPAMALTFAFTLACTSCSTGPQLERDETAQATLEQPTKGHNKRTPADAGVLEYRYLMESLPSGRSLANCRKFTAIT